MDQHQCCCAARAPVADMRARAIGQHDELRRRLGVFRFKRGARNVRPAQQPERASHKQGKQQDSAQNSAHAWFLSIRGRAAGERFGSL